MRSNIAIFAAAIGIALTLNSVNASPTELTKFYNRDGNKMTVAELENALRRGEIDQRGESTIMIDKSNPP